MSGVKRTKTLPGFGRDPGHAGYIGVETKRLGEIKARPYSRPTQGVHNHSFEVASLQHLSTPTMSTPYAITGIKDPGTIQPRLELRDLIKKNTQWSLFIRGLNEIQDLRSADPESPEYGNKPNSWWQIGKHIQT